MTDQIAVLRVSWELCVVLGVIALIVFLWKLWEAGQELEDE